MSTARASGRVFPTWIGGVPTTALSLTLVSRDPDPGRMPLVLPLTVFSSSTLPEADPITPIPESSGGAEKPFPLALFSRTCWRAVGSAGGRRDRVETRHRLRLICFGAACFETPPLQIVDGIEVSVGDPSALRGCRRGFGQGAARNPFEDHALPAPSSRGSSERRAVLNVTTCGLRSVAGAD